MQLLRTIKGLFTSLMCLLDDAVEPDENQLEQIRSFDTVIRQTHEGLSGYKYLTVFFAIFFKKIILIMKPSRAMSFTSLSKNYQMIPIQLMNLNCGSDKRLIMSLPMVIRRMRLKNFSRRILKN